MSLDVRSLTSRMCIGNLDMGLFLVMRPNPQTFQKTCRKRNSEVLSNSGWTDVHWGNERDVITVSGVTYSKIGNPDQYSQNEYVTVNTKSYLNSFVSSSGTSNHGPKQWADVDRFMLKLEQIYKTDKERVGSLADLMSGNIITNSISKLKNPFSKKNFNEAKQSRQKFLDSINNGTAARAQSFIIYNYCIYWGYFLTFNYNESSTDKPRQYSYNFTFKVTNSTTDWLSQSLINNFPEARIINMFSQVGDLASFGKNLISSDKLLKGIMI